MKTRHVFGPVLHTTDGEDAFRKIDSKKIRKDLKAELKNALLAKKQILFFSIVKHQVLI